MVYLQNDMYLQRSTIPKRPGGQGLRNLASVSPSSNHTAPGPTPNSSIVALNNILAARQRPGVLRSGVDYLRTRSRRKGWHEFSREECSTASIQPVSPRLRLQQLLLGNVSIETYGLFLYRLGLRGRHLHRRLLSNMR